MEPNTVGAEVRAARLFHCALSLWLATTALAAQAPNKQQRLAAAPHHAWTLSHLHLAPCQMATARAEGKQAGLLAGAEDRALPEALSLAPLSLCLRFCSHLGELLLLVISGM